MIRLELGYSHGIALRADGTGECVSANSHDQLDMPDFGGRKVVDIAAGPQTSLARLEDGRCAKWGNDINDETDFERIGELWAFSLGGGHDPGYATDSGFAIGIAPSFVAFVFSSIIRLIALR